MCTDELLDCVIIGGGPSGLTAGIYLKRYHRTTIIIDDNNSRAALIPLSHNYPGFSNGISGELLLKNLRTQYQKFQGTILHDTVNNIKRANFGFEIHTEKKMFAAQNVILATGVKDIEPSLPNLQESIKHGFVHHCAICDAYEFTNKRIGVIGSGIKGVNEALFLKTYTPDISLITLNSDENLTKHQIRKLQAGNINLILEHLSRITFYSNKTSLLITLSGKSWHFDALYSALGCIVNSSLATQLGITLLSSYIKVNKYQETSLKGLYAVGDITPGLNQLCVATSQAAIAATHLHNKLKRVSR